MRDPRTGFTLIELIVVIAVLAVLSTIAVVSFSRYTRAQALSGVVGAIASSLEDARSRTLSSQGGSQYGVHLEDGAAVLFKGDTYDVNGADNEATPLDARADIVATLAGGGSDIIFERLTGETDNHGTIEVTLPPGTVLSKTITVQQTGLLSYE